MGVQEFQDSKHIELSSDCGACGCIALVQSSTLILKAESDRQEHYERAGCASSARMLLMCACLTVAATSLVGWRTLPQISRIHQSPHSTIFWASPGLISSILSLASLLGAAFICTGISNMQLASLRHSLRLTSIILAFSLAFMAAAFSTRIAVEDTA